MTPREKLIVTMAASTLFAALVLGGCQADTLIARVDGGSGGQSASGTGGSVGTGGTGGSNPGTCPAGPSLGAACTTPDLRCAYGYNPPACGGRTVICKNGSFIEESHSDPQTSCFDGGADTPVTAQCCPRDQTTSGCMHLGGANQNAHSCDLTCDFWCSTNWRVVNDAQGCETWTFDHRQPAPGEDPQCMVRPDAGNGDAISSDSCATCPTVGGLCSPSNALCDVPTGVCACLPADHKWHVSR